MLFPVVAAVVSVSEKLVSYYYDSARLFSFIKGFYFLELIEI